MGLKEIYKPGVSRNVLLFVAGFVWVCAGSYLLFLAILWLSAAENINLFIFAGSGVGLALLIHHLGFLRIVDQNLNRIIPMQGERCLFSFMPWKSYLIIAVMIFVGFLLRHSDLPKSYLAILYIAIGLALILSSKRYMRVFLREKSV